MPGKIDVVSSQPATGATGSTGQRAASASGPAPAAGNATDSVRITDTASHLATAEQALSEVPIVNSTRIAQIGAALASGGYRILPARIADRLLQFERQLPEDTAE
ncbi:MAG TPA: flagellar biosynthesis anti-sigma factor FlgM [Steroidobacteraceae bacterium]|nr:flagellar biosynthesis anti-sigma factor FlgM [Steroidobacteraceae bacterium]